MDVRCPEATLNGKSVAQPKRDLARTARWVAQQSGGQLAFAFSPASPCKYSLTLKRSQSWANVFFSLSFLVLYVSSLVNAEKKIHCLSGWCVSCEVTTNNMMEGFCDLFLLFLDSLTTPTIHKAIYILLWVVKGLSCYAHSLQSCDLTNYHFSVFNWFFDEKYFPPNHLLLLLSAFPFRRSKRSHRCLFCVSLTNTGIIVARR